MQTSKRGAAASAGRPARRESGCVARVMTPRLFKALCDPNRITILARLAETGGPCSVGDIARCCTVSLSVVSRHLAMLRDAGVVESVKHGKEVHYSVRAGWLARTLRAMADALETCCPPPPEPSGGAARPGKEKR